MRDPKPEPTYFASPAEFRAWLERHHATARELLVGFHKRGTGRPSMTWPESVDEALCFGWIDGVRRRVDEERYTIRFTPRRPRSTWSAVNIRRARALEKAGRMTPAGRAAFARREGDRSAMDAHGQRRAAKLAPAQEARLRADAAAWAFLQAQPPWYRRATAHWVASAKQEPTQERRLAQLIACSAEGRHVPPLARPAGGRAEPARKGTAAKRRVARTRTTRKEG